MLAPSEPASSYAPQTNRAGARAESQLVVIRGDAKRTLKDSTREVVANRGLVAAMALRAIKLRYRQAAFGLAWAVVQPAAYIVVFTLFFGHALGVGSGGAVPYAAFSVSATVIFQFASNGVGLGSMAIVQEMPLLKRAYFCRETPVAATVVTAMVDLGIGTIMMLLIGPVLGAREGWHLVFLPVCVLPLIGLVYGISLILSGINVYFRDVRYVVPLATQLWLFVSPVAYPITRIPAGLRLPYAFLNPVAGPLEGVRQCVALGQMPNWELLGASTAVVVLILLLGMRLFNRIEGGFADAI